MSDIDFPDWIFDSTVSLAIENYTISLGGIPRIPDSSLPKPRAYVHANTDGTRMVSYLGRYIETIISGLSVANESHEWEASYIDCKTGWKLGINKNRLDGSIESWLILQSETRLPAFTYEGIPVFTSNQEVIDGNITLCHTVQTNYNMVP